MKIFKVKLSWNKQFNPKQLLHYQSAFFHFFKIGELRRGERSWPNFSTPAYALAFKYQENPKNSFRISKQYFLPYMYKKRNFALLLNVESFTVTGTSGGLKSIPNFLTKKHTLSNFLFEKLSTFRNEILQYAKKAFDKIYDFQRLKMPLRNHRIKQFLVHSNSISTFNEMHVAFSRLILVR